MVGMYSSLGARSCAGPDSAGELSWAGMLVADKLNAITQRSLYSSSSCARLWDYPSSKISLFTGRDSGQCLLIPPILFNPTSYSSDSD
jgi:hypothetical protein